MFEIGLWLVLVILLVGLGLVVVVCIWRSRVQQALKQLSSGLRGLIEEHRQVQMATTAYSPTDPEPFGPLARALSEQLDSIDERIRDLHKKYGQARENIPGPRASIWQVAGRALFRGFHTRRQVAELRRLHEEVVADLKTVDDLARRLEGQGWETARRARKCLENVYRAGQIVERLRAGNVRDQALEGMTGEVGRQAGILRTRLPGYFLLANEGTVLAQADKASIAEAYAVLKDAQPLSEALLAKAQAWENHYRVLQQALVELNLGLPQILMQMTSLEMAPTRPIAWGKSRSEFMALSRQTGQIKAIHAPRTLDQLKKDSALANGLNDQQERLAYHCQEIEEQRQQLLALLISPNLQWGREWCRKARELSAQVAVYHSKNWQPPHIVSDLPADLERLAELQHRLVDNDPAAAISETMLQQHLRETQKLANLHETLRERVETIREQLAKIQETESSAQERLAVARDVLDRIASLTNPGFFFQGNVASEGKRLQGRAKQLVRELDQPHRGTVEEKARKTEALVEQVERASNTWLDQLIDDIGTKGGTLAEKLDALKTDVGILEDRPIVEAQKLLSQLKRTQGTGKSRKKSRLSLADVVTELEHRSEDWQECVVVLREIEEIEKPLMEWHRRVEQQREQAYQQLTRAAERVPDIRSWPPTAQSLTGVRQEFNKIGGQWDTLKKERLKAFQWMSKMGSLSDRYKKVSEQAGEIAKRAREEQDKIEDWERKLGQVRQLWERQGEKHSSSGGGRARREIRKLLDEIDGELRTLRERYERGSKSYRQVLQGLESLCRKAENAQVVVDDGHQVDVHGLVRPLR